MHMLGLLCHLQLCAPNRIWAQSWHLHGILSRDIRLLLTNMSGIPQLCYAASLFVCCILVLEGELPCKASSSTAWGR